MGKAKLYIDMRTTPFVFFRFCTDFPARFDKYAINPRLFILCCLQKTAPKFNGPFSDILATDGQIFSELIYGPRSHRTVSQLRIYVSSTSLVMDAFDTKSVRNTNENPFQSKPYLSLKMVVLSHCSYKGRRPAPKNTNQPRPITYRAYKAPSLVEHRLVSLLATTLQVDLLLLIDPGSAETSLLP